MFIKPLIRRWGDLIKLLLSIRKDIPLPGEDRGFLRLRHILSGHPPNRHHLILVQCERKLNTSILQLKYNILYRKLRRRLMIFFVCQTRVGYRKHKNRTPFKFELPRQYNYKYRYNITER